MKRHRKSWPVRRTPDERGRSPEMAERDTPRRPVIGLFGGPVRSQRQAAPAAPVLTQRELRRIVVGAIG